MSDRDLPLLDIADLDAGPDAARRFREKLREATHEVGFFHLRHRIPTPVTDELFDVTRAFFALPEQDKLAVEMTKSPWFRGYTRTGGEYTQGSPDWREQIDIGSERRPNTVIEPAYLRLDGPNQWPAALPRLRPVIDAWIERLSALGDRLVREWSVALGASPDHFDATFDHPSILLKLVRYPSQVDVGQGAAGQGVGAHKDPGILTLLLVEPGKGGLQVQRDDDWFDVPPVDDAFVGNIGELLEVATDGYLRATKHRVVSPVAGSERLSIPFFFNPGLDAEVPRIDLPADLAVRARGVEQDASNVLGSRYGENLLKARLRAHPDVAAIHHADLVG
ncbi:isopenicillin N synthase family oxygenase [Gordonia sp. TBRC 11910]|uniref:Isopenicillin N synthase family oxygenase n=1 Tax=Gordonia asplenii TaxID=2725283 RepID=A0A848L7J7_9ACTN|nr:isopenicillin N synthase family oxygenase [Gordonia asplenii]NMO04703.1 isopenicillin N synthase family oxygenase [Gordonia asplenii]